MVLLIDNYDSFVFNLARYVSELGFEQQVVRNDKITVAEIAQLSPSHIIISPGPCAPNEAGISLDVIKVYGKTVPILGVCLGHQAIGQAYGGKIARAAVPMHGKSSLVTHCEHTIFARLNNPLVVARYHSLIVSALDLPSELIITATSQEGEIMGLMHRMDPVYGVQFHPESVLTEQGHQLLNNFLQIVSNTLS
jgi:anthranilate synthase/aminodeoxychorismate synthase-like glutamine amidotransferase